MKRTVKRRLAALVACLAALSMIVPSAACAHETNAEQTVEIVIQQNGDSALTAEVPIDKADEYRAKLENPEFRAQEIAKISTSMVEDASVVTKPNGTRIYYYGKKETMQMLNSIEHSGRWTRYIDHPMTAAIIQAACNRIDKSGRLADFAEVLRVAASDLLSRQEKWWKESAKLIVRQKIHGVKITMVPNNGGYPVMYRYIARY